MRSRLLLCFIAIGIVLSAVPSIAQDSIPVFPGSKAEFELNLTQKDFLPVLRQWIGLVPGVFAGYVTARQEAGGGQSEQSISNLAALSQEVVKGVQEVLAGVNQVSVVAYQQPKDVPFEKIADFYVQEVRLGSGWQRTFLGQRPEGSAMLYVKPDLMGMFAVGMGGGYVAAAKVDGKIDLVKIGELVAKYGPMIALHLGASMSGGGVAGPGEVDVPTTQPAEPGWSLVLVEVGPQRVRVLEAIRQLTCMSPTEAREFIQSLPQTLSEGLSEEDAQALRARFEEMGAKVEVKKAE